MANHRRSRGNSVRPPSPPPNIHRLGFSFRYFQPDHPKFNASVCGDGYLQCLISALRRYSCLTLDEFRQFDGDDPHRHAIHFPETTEPDGFTGIDPDVEELWTDEAWQFAISDSKEPPHGGWRVHGFINGNVFHVVWLDHGHCLYPTAYVEKQGKKLVQHLPPPRESVPKAKAKNKQT